jgi:hypothetical protein
LAALTNAPLAGAVEATVSHGADDADDAAPGPLVTRKRHGVAPADGILARPERARGATVDDA